MLQSWQYGHAKQTVENWVAHRYIIINENGEEIALVQVFIKKIPIIGFNLQKVLKINCLINYIKNLQEVL